MIPSVMRYGMPCRSRFLRLAGRFAFVGLASCAVSCLVRGVPGAMTEARASYLRACASCHGGGGRGDGPVAPALSVSPPDLTVLASRRGGTFPRQEVIEIVAGERPIAAHGTREMPVWSQRFGPSGSGAAAVASFFMRRRLELIVDYVESLQRAE